MSTDSDHSNSNEDSFLSDCLSELPSEDIDSPQIPSNPTAAPAQNSSPHESDQHLPSERRGREADAETRPRESSPAHLATSTFLSLVMVLALLLLARLIVPSLVESIRYGWYRGQLRAEYEISGEQLNRISIDSLAEVSRLVSHRMGPSVVHINVLKGNLLRLGSMTQGQGSGFIIGSDGYVLTNEHVLEGDGNIEVTLSDGRKFSADVVGRDWQTDLAVLKIDASNLMAVEWGTSEKVGVGTPVWAVGSPFGLQQTVTFGIISGKHRVDFRSAKRGKGVPGAYGDLMQSDVALNPGNSGGPLVNSMGQVVGVNAAILGDTFQGVSFSIPSDVAKQVAEQLIESGSVPRGWLGVSLGELTQREKFDDEGNRNYGVRVLAFPEGSSPAKRAGLRVGDVIVSFEGTPVDDTASLIRMIGGSLSGAEVKMEIERRVPKLEKVEDGSELENVNASDDDAPPEAESLSEDSNDPGFELKRFEVTVKLELRDPDLPTRR